MTANIGRSRCGRRSLLRCGSRQCSTRRIQGIVHPVGALALTEVAAARQNAAYLPVTDARMVHSEDAPCYRCGAPRIDGRLPHCPFLRESAPVSPKDSRHEQHPEAVAGAGRPADRLVLRAAVVGRRDLPRRATDAREGRGRTARSSTPAPTSSRAARSGSRSAACSSARSGATAATSRRTGAPTGCIAKRSTCSTCGRGATTARATYARLAGRAAGRPARPPAADDAHQHLRPGDARRSR